MKAIIIRIIKQMKNDKRSLALILFAPIFVISLMYVLLNDNNYSPTVVLKNVDSQMAELLKKENLILLDSNEDSKELLKSKKIDGVISNNGLILDFLEPNDHVSKINKALKNVNNSLNPNRVITTNFIYGSIDDSTFQSLSFVFLGIYSFLFVFLLSGIAFIRERTLGTIERFMLAPIKKYEVILGFLIGFGFFAIIQSLLLIIYVKYVLNLIILGSIFNVILIMVLLSFIAVALGSLISVLANNEFQMIQFIPIIIVPQIFFSGLININTFKFGFDKIALFMPVYHACLALRKIISHGSNFNDIIFEIFILLLFVIVLFFANIFVLKRYRSIKKVPFQELF